MRFMSSTFFFFPRHACKIAMGHIACSFNNNNKDDDDDRSIIILNRRNNNNYQSVTISYNCKC